MMVKRLLIALTAGSLASIVTPSALAAAPGTSKSASGDAKKEARKAFASSDEAAIREQLAALASNASAGNGEKMALIWTSDATYVDEDGAKTVGRQELARRFAEGLSARGKVTVLVKPESIKVLGLDAAWVQGTTNRQTTFGLEPAVRFTMLMRKENGTWLIASATETGIANRSAADHLSALDWLVGEWRAEQGKAKVKMTAEWVNNKNFIHCLFHVDRPDGEQKVDSQIIGWDPTRDQIVSWHFGSTGGFGYGSWSRRGTQWVVEAEAVDQSGSRSAATNIISVESPDKFSWQSIGRSVDGLSMPDTEPLTVTRSVAKVGLLPVGQ